MNNCQSCKEDRKSKNLPPMDRIKLPAEVTRVGFFKPIIPVYVCPYCDGETLVAGALRTSRERQAA